MILIVCHCSNIVEYSWNIIIVRDIINVRIKRIVRDIINVRVKRIIAMKGYNYCKGQENCKEGI